MNARRPKLTKLKATDPKDALAKVRQDLKLRGFDVRPGDDVDALKGYGIKLFGQSEGEQVAVAIVPQNEDLNHPNWSKLDTFIAGLDKTSPNTKRSTLEIHQWTELQPPFWVRHPKAVARFLAVAVPVFVALIAAATFYFSVYKKATPTKQEIDDQANSGRSAGSTSLSSAPSIGASGPLAPVSPPVPDDVKISLEQALNNYLLQKLGSNFVAHHYQGVYLKFWLPPQPTWDPTSQTATCSIDGSIEAQDGTTPLTRHTWGPETSGTGSGGDETIGNACKAAVDDMVSSYQAQQ